MTSPEVLQKTPDLTDPGCNNFVKVDPGTLRHVKFPNIFSLGDCSTLPTSKTAAAAGAFCVVKINHFTNHLERASDSLFGQIN